MGPSLTTLQSSTLHVKTSVGERTARELCQDISVTPRRQNHMRPCVSASGDEPGE